MLPGSRLLAYACRLRGLASRQGGDFLCLIQLLSTLRVGSRALRFCVGHTPVSQRLVCLCVGLQVEFYFSDSNLPKDKFLKSQVENHPDGCE